MPEGRKVIASPTRKFVIQIVDPRTKCVVSESVFETSDIAALCEIIDPEASEIPVGVGYDLEKDDVQRIESRFDVAIECGLNVARLRSWILIDGLPYKVHTNRELTLMLKGVKPFAAFSELYAPGSDEEFIPETTFQPYVESKLLTKVERILSVKGRDIRFVLYARSGEEWRINAYMLLQQTAQKVSWNEGFERMEGSLLGYTEWENDICIKEIYARPRG